MAGRFDFRGAARRPALLAAMVAGLAISGALLDRVAAPAWAEVRARQPALRLDSSVAAAGQGVTLALLGGFRALVADAVWVRMYVLWEQHDLPAVETFVRLVTAIDPRPVYFWLNGARIIAYDLSAWRIDAAGGDAVAPGVQQQITREHARLALNHLEDAMTFHPASAELWIERANIELQKLGDIAAAAESYRKAFELPRGPFYAARLHAQLLRRLGRDAEALAWLIKVHPMLPAAEKEDGDVVLDRIREIERALGVPAERAYRPPP